MRLYTVQCTVKFIWLADFVFLLYVAQSRQSARLFLQSSSFRNKKIDLIVSFMNKHNVCMYLDVRRDKPLIYTPMHYIVLPVPCCEFSQDRELSYTLIINLR